jgi:hypothetical protein
LCVATVLEHLCPLTGHLFTYVCCTINIPSGLCSKYTGLENKVDVKVSSCGNKLELECSWPETLTVATGVENALSVMWNQQVQDGTPTICGVGNTVANMLLAFELQLHKLRRQNLVSTNNMLGATCTIDLPFNVEAELVVCETTWDRLIHSVNLYVVLKKRVKSEDQIGTKKGGVHICNGLEQMTGQVKKPRYVQQHTGSGRSSSGRRSGSTERHRITSVQVPTCSTDMEDESIGSATTAEW